MKFSKRENLCRLAGFFEGEGCINIVIRHPYKKRVGYYLRTTVTQMTRNGHYHRFLELFRKYFGGTIVASSKLNKRGKRRSCYRVANLGAVKLLETLLPYFEEKRDRAELAIKLSRIKLKSNGKDSRWSEKKGLAEEIRRLNHIR